MKKGSYLKPLYLTKRAVATGAAAILLLTMPCQSIIRVSADAIVASNSSVSNQTSATSSSSITNSSSQESTSASVTPSNATTSSVSTAANSSSQPTLSVSSTATTTSNSNDLAAKINNDSKLSSTDKSKLTAILTSDSDEITIDDVGKGNNFKPKIYLEYFGEKLNDVVAFANGDKVKLELGLAYLLIDQTNDGNIASRFDVSSDTIKHLITTYILYDVAFAKKSVLLSLVYGSTTSSNNSDANGLYPNTTQLTGSTLNNEDGKQMNLKAYYVNQNSDKTVVIHCGFRGNWNAGIKTPEYDVFYNKGYNLLFVDSRATGGSDGNYITYGQYESDDVLYWINQEIQARPNQKIVLYGTSMGAATMMSVLAKNPPANVKGIIENCGFKSIDEQLRYTYSSTIAPALAKIVGSWLDIASDKAHEDLYMGLMKTYYFDQELKLNTTQNLPEIGMATNISKLIIHGDADTVVPVSNAKTLYSLSNGYKDELIVAGADHGKSQEVDPTAYQEHIDSFFDTIFNKKFSVTVNYKDADNNEIAKASELTGNIGDAYQANQKDIPGYTFKEVKGNPKGTFTNQNQTVTYVYTKNPIKTSNVIVNYIDTAHNEIAKAVELTGNIGDAYQTTQKDIDGYTFKEVTGNTKGTFSNQTQVVTYLYIKNSVKTSTVNINYKDTDNNVIAKPSQLTGNIGDAYQTTQRNIAGYTFKEVKGNAKGTFGEKDQTVTYIYTKNSNADNGGNNSNTNGSDSNNTNSQNSNVSNNIDSKNNNPSLDNMVAAHILPQSGETNFEKATMFGIILITLSIIGACFITIKRNKKI